MSAEAEESAEPQSVILSIKAIAAAFAVCFYAHELLNAIVEQKVKGELVREMAIALNDVEMQVYGGYNLAELDCLAENIEGSDWKRAEIDGCKLTLFA